MVYAYTASGSRVGVIVPNNVANVKFGVPRVPATTAAVHHNRAAFLVKGSELVRIVGRSRMTWYSGTGRVLKRIGPAGLRH